MSTLCAMVGKVSEYVWFFIFVGLLSLLIALLSQCLFFPENGNEAHCWSVTSFADNVGSARSLQWARIARAEALAFKCVLVCYYYGS